MRTYLIAAILLSPCYAHAQSAGSITGTVTFEAGSVTRPRRDGSSRAARSNGPNRR